MKGYATITSPLYMLISGGNASKKSKVVNWTEECQAAFKAVKDLCTSAPIPVLLTPQSPLNYVQIPVASDLGLSYTRNKMVWTK